MILYDFNDFVSNIYVSNDMYLVQSPRRVKANTLQVWYRDAS